MKKNRLFLVPLMAATLSLGSCSSDSPDMGGSDNTFKGDQAFMKVRIAMANDPGTRSATDGGYEYGSPAEQAIKTLGFKFYKEDGSFYTYGNSQGPITTTEEKPIGGNVEAVAEAVISLEIKNGDVMPKYVVAYVNCGEETNWKRTAEPSLDEITYTIDNFEYGTGNNKGYVMTSSNNSSACYKTIVSADKFKDNESDAKNEGTPVDIYVERVAAKMTVTLANNLEENNHTITKGEYSFKFKVKGFGLGGKNKKSYLIKNLDPSWTGSTPWSEWEPVDVTNYPYRCFWAKDINYNYEEVGKDSDGNYILDYSSYNTANKAPESYIYCHENTFASANGSTINPYLVQPFAYITGIYTVTRNGNAIEEDLFNYKGSIYTSSEMIKNIQTEIGAVLYIQTTEGSNTKFEQADLAKLVDIVAYDSNNLKLELKKDVDATKLTKYYILTGTDPQQESSYAQSPTTDQVKKILADAKPVKADGFKYVQDEDNPDNSGHLAYFPVLIEHLNYKTDTDTDKYTTATQPVGAYGIVRNHIYRLEITSIKNLGIGVFDPSVVIIPSDTKIKYLGAKIRILSWKVVNQKVDL